MSHKLILYSILTLLFTEIATAGPIFLSGDDSDDHLGACTSPINNVLQNMLDNVTNGGSNILVLGVLNENSPSNGAGNFIKNVETLDCLTPSQTVTFKSGINIDTVSFTGYAIIYVPSDSTNIFGGINQSDNTKVVNRKSDIQTFVNGGGGLFILTQGDTLTDKWDMVIGDCGQAGDVQVLTVDSLGFFPDCVVCDDCSVNPPQSDCYDNVATTSDGSTLGITDTNYDHCCFHNVFTSFPSFHKALATCDTSNITAGVGVSYSGQAASIGGITTICPADDWGWTHRP